MQQVQQKTDQASSVGLPIGIRVANAMHKLGVVGLPRNYEVFYGALNGTNPDLKKEFYEIGTALDQEALDGLFSKYCTRADDEKFVGKFCDTIEQRLLDTISLLKSEYGSMSKYSKILDQAADRLQPRTKVPQETLNKMVGALASATKATQQDSRKVLDEIETKSCEIETMKSELEEYKRLADTDPLTGLLNRRAFDEMLSELDTGRLRQTALVIGDIDQFKTLNDTYGHPFGDMVIKTVAKIAQANVREDSILARIGGEEFALVSPNIDESGIERLAERIRVAVAETSFTDGRVRLPPGKVTISFGVCHASGLKSGQQLYANADEALMARRKREEIW